MPYKPVDAAIKVILGPLIDDTDFKTREEAVAFNAAGMEIHVILEKADGTVTTTAVVPTEAGDPPSDYDWAHTEQGYYELELPAGGGAGFNNSEEGILHVAGYCTGVLPFRSPAYDVVPQQVYNSLVKDTEKLQISLNAAALESLMIADAATHEAAAAAAGAKDSLLGLILQQKHADFTAEQGKVVIYQTDDTTRFDELDLVSNPTAAPVTKVSRA